MEFQKKNEMARQEWSTGLFDCFDDIYNTCLTFWCPCITFGQITEILDKGATPCSTAAAIYTVIALCTGCPWIYAFVKRTEMRTEYNLPEAPCADFCVHFWCDRCSICQMSRELKNRGWDISLGYQRNLETRGSKIQLPAVPPPSQGMIR